MEKELMSFCGTYCGECEWKEKTTAFAILEILS